MNNTDLVGARLAREPCEARPFIGYAISRNSRRRILPTGVIGNDSRNTMCLGTLYGVLVTWVICFNSCDK